MNTSAKILDKALELFNERGIEYVGLRELAAILDMRVSNITYYFPTKDDLVYQLSVQLSELNNRTIVLIENVSMRSFLEMLHQVFLNHVKYRCLLLSFVHLMERNKVMSLRYKETQSLRSTTLQANIRALAASGQLKAKDVEEQEFLVSALSLISRFWISEAAISFRQLSTTGQIKYYLTIVAKLLLPYATAKAKKEIQLFCSELSEKG